MSIESRARLVVIPPLLVVVAAVLFPGCAQRSPAASLPELPIELDRALDYEIVREEDISSRGRSRARAFIYSPAKTIDERAHTTFQAAVDLQERTGSSFVKVFHLISPDPEQVGLGTYLAVVSFAPDGRGIRDTPLRNVVWEAEVTDAVVDDVSWEIERLWWAHRDRFQVSDGIGGTETDEEQMKRFIARELRIPEAQVKLVWFWLQPYPEAFVRSPGSVGASP